MGKKNWSDTTIMSILTNEKHKSEAILQKSFVVDYLTKKAKRNEGEVPMYHVKNSHEAIIDPEVFDLVQAEIEKRKKLKGSHSGNSVFSSKIICGQCGEFYGPRTFHSNSKYKLGSPQNVSFEDEKEQLCSVKYFSDKKNRLAEDAVTRQCNPGLKKGMKCEAPLLYKESIKKHLLIALINCLKIKMK